MRNMKVQYNDSEYKDDSVLKVLKSLDPQISEQYEIAKQSQIIDGLKELQIDVSNALP